MRRWADYGDDIARHYYAARLGLHRLDEVALRALSPIALVAIRRIRVALCVRVARNALALATVRRDIARMTSTIESIWYNDRTDALTDDEVLLPLLMPLVVRSFVRSFGFSIVTCRRCRFA
jgi:hypothetical protein